MSVLLQASWPVCCEEFGRVEPAATHEWSEFVKVGASRVTRWGRSLLEGCCFELHECFELSARHGNGVRFDVLFKLTYLRASARK